MQEQAQSTPGAWLARNLTSLKLVQADLHERLHWSTAGDHLFRDEDNVWTYRHHGTDFPAHLTPQEVAQACDGMERDLDGAVLVFGVGLGELVHELLTRCPSTPIIAWERDPWVLRQALSSWDWSAELSSGRLRLALNADLVFLLDQAAHSAHVCHPLLGRVYSNELLLLTTGIGAQRALLCCGTLFVASVADALREEGMSVFSMDVQRIAIEESQQVVQSFKPEVVISINHVNGLAEFCEAEGLDYLCWEIDPATDEPRALQGPLSRTQIFTHSQANVSVFRRAGYEQVSYLPLAADPGRRQPLRISDEQSQRYGAQVSFVGASLMLNVEPFQQAFREQLAAWSSIAPEQTQASLEQIIGQQRSDFSTYIIPELLDARHPGFRSDCAARGLPDPALLLAEVSAAEKRLNYLAELGEHDLALWGDAGWAQLSAHGARYHGPALHETELPLIYNASAINVDIGRLYQNGIVTMRVFDILACGGFVLAEHSPALEELFKVGVEVESYRTLAELKGKVAHYLAHADEARSIARRGRAAVLSRHTIASRLRTMLDAASRHGSMSHCRGNGDGQHV